MRIFTSAIWLPKILKHNKRIAFWEKRIWLEMYDVHIDTFHSFYNCGNCFPSLSFSKFIIFLRICICVRYSDLLGLVMVVVVHLSGCVPNQIELFRRTFKSDTYTRTLPHQSLHWRSGKAYAAAAKYIG